MSKRVLLGLAIALALNGAAVAAAPNAADRLAQAVKAYEASGAGEDDGEGGPTMRQQPRASAGGEGRRGGEVVCAHDAHDGRTGAAARRLPVG